MDSSRKRRSFNPMDEDNAFNKKLRESTSAKEEEEIIGIPNEKLEGYKKIRKIKQFYPWQLEFVNDVRLINGQNAFLTAETGGGKTLVAELLILRTMITKGCSAIFALPFVSLVNEKIPIFEALSDVFGITIKQFAGPNYTYPIPLPNQTLYICTFEFASMVCKNLKEADKLKDIGLLVLDEIHMVSEALRGTTVEMLLTNYRSLLDEQIIAMSATVGNVQQLTKWVNGFHYHSSFRPVPLREYVVSNGYVLIPKDDHLSPERVLTGGTLWYGQLAFEVVPQHSVLMFCNSRDACEDACNVLCRNVPNALEMHKFEDRMEFVDNLIIACKNDGHPLPEKLQKGIENGIAFHHSKISMIQRKAIEQGFRDGIISIICSTTTLAAGVNLPVRRVIMKTAKIGWNIMDKTCYLQMAGRAGRAGLDDVGESFILADEDYERVSNLVLRDAIPECESRLEKKLEAFVFNNVSLGHNTEKKLKDVMDLTLYACRNPNAADNLEQTIVELIEPEFLLENSQNELTLSPIAYVAQMLRIDPRDMAVLLEYFKVYKSSPLSILAKYIPLRTGVKINFEVFRAEYSKLNNMDKRILDKVSYEFVINGIVPSKLKLCYRFYAAMMIFRLFKDKLEDVECAKMFGVEKFVLHKICKHLFTELKRLKRASNYLEEMTSLRKPLTDLINFLEKYCKDL